MTREEAIEVIEQLYPADSGYIDTAAIGRQFLAEARAIAWRKESDEVLIEYAKLCEEKERIADKLHGERY